MSSQSEQPKEHSENSSTEEVVDSRDLVNKPSYIADGDPDEVVDNPAVTPSMLGEDKQPRTDLKSD